MSERRGSATAVARDEGFQCGVSGTSQPERARLLARLRALEKRGRRAHAAYLVREPHNGHDRCAIAVCVDTGRGRGCGIRVTHASVRQGQAEAFPALGCE